MVSQTGIKVLRKYRHLLYEYSMGNLMIDGAGGLARSLSLFDNLDLNTGIFYSYRPILVIGDFAFILKILVLCLCFE